jgi:hypothetical protein
MVDVPIRSANPPPSSIPQLPKSAIGGGSGGIGMAGSAGAVAGIISLGSRLASGQSLPQAAAGAAATGIGAGIGTAAGAAIGTALLPGAGTAIGGAIGGALGGAIGSALADALMPGSAESQQPPTKKSWSQVASFEAPANQTITVTWYAPTQSRTGPPSIATNVQAFIIDENTIARDRLKVPYPEYVRIRFLVNGIWGSVPEQGNGIDPATLNVIGATNPPLKKGGEENRERPSVPNFGMPSSLSEAPPTDPRNPGNSQNFPKPQPKGSPHPASAPNLGGNLPNNVGAVPLKITPFEQALPGGSNTSGNLLNPGGSTTTGAPTGSTMPAPISPNVAGVRPSQAPQPVGSLTATPPATETKTTSDPRIDEILKQLEAITPQLALLPLLFAAQAEKPNPLSAADTQKAAAAGTCDSAAPSGCLGKPLGEIKDEASGANQAAKSADKKLDEVNAAVNALDLALLGRMDKKLDGINNKLGPQIPGGISGRLGKVFNGVSRMWDMLQVDRALNILSWIGILHNALMLSSNLGSTLFSVIDTWLNAFGFKFTKMNDEGNPEEVDSQELIGSYTLAFMNQIFGAENVARLTLAWQKANRIYQAASNMLNAVQSMMDAARSIAEDTAGKIGRIGNALINAGTVAENAYGRMQEKVTGRSVRQAKFDNFLQGLETTENILSTIEQIGSNVVEFQDGMKELQEARTEFEKAKQDGEKFLSDKAEVEKKASESPEIGDLSFVLAPQGEDD